MKNNFIVDKKYGSLVYLCRSTTPTQRENVAVNYEEKNDKLNDKKFKLEKSTKMTLFWRTTMIGTEILPIVFIIGPKLRRGGRKGRMGSSLIHY